MSLWSQVVSLEHPPSKRQPKSDYDNTALDAGSRGRLLIGDAIDIMKSMPNYATEILPTFDSLTVDGSNRIVACNEFLAGAITSGQETARRVLALRRKLELIVHLRAEDQLFH
ncbi:MAG: hypothetical protein IZT59_12195 [Verrucomicrobia bacterium]|nr:hypothetical protein [Verrucomicrobiota bacterium]